MARLSNFFQADDHASSEWSPESTIVLASVSSNQSSATASTKATSQASSTAQVPRTSKHELPTAEQSWGRVQTSKNASTRKLNAPQKSIRPVNTIRPLSNNASGTPLASVMSESKNDLLNESIKALDMDWRMPSPGNSGPKEVSSQKRKSRRIGAISKVAANALESTANTATALGKRTREAYDNSKDTLKRMGSLRPRGNDGLHVKTEERDDNSTRSQKKVKVEMSSDHKQTVTISEEQRISRPKKVSSKKWLDTGLYVGQARTFNARMPGGQNKSKKPVDSGVSRDNHVLPQPMFRGEQLLEQGRPFKLPFDIFSPLPPGQPKPEEWRKTQSNRFVGDAASQWKKMKPLPSSRCTCSAEYGCDEHCLNRLTGYECNESNCSLSAEECKHRPFADLRERCKTGKKYDVGVEVMKTADRGFGVRACRTFARGQIITEYAGEIVTQEECERRMMEEYKDNKCYYLMAFDQRMIIDATRGSMARFINHSCDPNGEMLQLIVGDRPRMALFAKRDIMTGEELTYDYNFNNFNPDNVQACYCGSWNCNGTLGPSSDRTKSKLGLLAGAKRKLEDFLKPSDSKANVGVSGNRISKKPRLAGHGRRASAPLPTGRIENRISSTSTGGTTLVGSSSSSPHSQKQKAGSARSSGDFHIRGSATPVARTSSKSKIVRRHSGAGLLGRAKGSIKKRALQISSGASLKRRNTLGGESEIRKTTAARKEQRASTGAKGTGIWATGTWVWADEA